LKSLTIHGFAYKSRRSTGCGTKGVGKSPAGRQPGRDVPLSDATRAYGRAHTVAQVVARLRCQRCRRQPIDVQLIRTIDPHGAAAAIKALLAQFAAGSASTRHIG
jgi:hypothetical protein